MATRVESALMPSFFASGVPEYPAMSRPGSRACAEPGCRPGARACGFDVAVARVGRRHQRVDEDPRRRRNVRDGTLERGLVRLRRHVEAAELADELQRGIAYFDFRGRRLEVEEGLDVSAHGSTHDPSAARGHRRWTAPGPSGS